MEKWREEVEKVVRYINSVSVSDISENELPELVEFLSTNLTASRELFRTVLEDVLRYQVITDKVLGIITKKVPEIDTSKYLLNNFRYGENKTRLLQKLEVEGLAFVISDRMYIFFGPGLLISGPKYEIPIYHSLKIISLSEIRNNISSFSGYDTVYCDYKVISIPLSDVISVNIENRTLTFMGSHDIIENSYYNSEFKLWRKI